MSEYKLLDGLLKLQLERRSLRQVVCEKESVPLIIRKNVREKRLELALGLSWLLLPVGRSHGALSSVDGLRWLVFLDLEAEE